MPRRPILLALAVALLTTGAILLLVRAAQPGTPAEARAAVGKPAPAITGTTLDGAAFDLAAFAGKPVVVNFWGPSCVPCRDEFPLLAAKLAEHGADGLTVVGVLTDDPVEPARDFVAQYGGSWPTVVDPDKTLRATYRIAGRPQTYFIDRTGVLRSIQIGEMRDADFERQYAQIAR
jgi:cytochrome c biogenesis protein CcmG/thiol:disulfide interchange protein DsbE